MGNLIFHRHADVEPPYVDLVEPADPPKRAQSRLARLGFELDENNGLWCLPLSELGRRNMSCAAISDRLRAVGLDARVINAPEEEEYATGADETDDEGAAALAATDEENEAEDGDDDGEVAAYFEWLETMHGQHAEHTDRVDLRLYNLALRVDELEAANRTLLAILRPLTQDPGEAGRTILGDEDQPRHEFEKRTVYFDRCRGVPVVASPEEQVRQRVLRHLEEHLGVPRHYLLSELRLPRSTDRADIVIWIPGDDDERKFLAVIECKSARTPMNDDVWMQAQRYGTKLNAPYVGITNGSSLHARRFSPEASAWLTLQGFPTFQMLLSHHSPPPSAPPARAIARPDFGSLGDAFYLERYAEAHAVVPVAVHDDLNHLAMLVNLASLLLDDAESPKDFTANGWTCTHDRGLIDTSFGNAGYSSHAYSGMYRALIVAHPKHGSGLPFFRTFQQQSGSTMLAMGLHHLDGRQHHAVQLNLTRALEFDDEREVVRVVHDGRMSKGGGGSFSRSDVIATVQQDAPDLIHDGRAVLGELPTDRLVTWEDAFPMLVNLFRFARAADRLRTT